MQATRHHSAMQPTTATSLTDAPKTPLGTIMQSLKRTALYILFFSLAINFLSLMLPIYTLQVFDRVFTTRNIDTLIGLSALTVFALAFFGLLYAIRSAIIARVAEWMDHQLSIDLVKQAIHTASVDHTTTAGQPLREMQTLKQFMITGAPIIADAPWSILFVFVIYLIHPLIGFMALMGMLIFIAAAIVNEYVTKKTLMRANLANVQSQLGADLLSQNAQTIQAMGMLNGVIHHWRKFYDESVRAQESAQRKGAVLQGITRATRMILQILVIGVGAFLVMEGSLSAGGLIASNILIARVLAPFEGLIGLWRQFTAARQSYSRLQHLFTHTPPAHGTTKLPTPRGGITVESLFFAPKGKPAILRGISFQLHPGEALGVIGPSGAGKSTLAKCLVGIYPPNHGHIRLDGADVYQWLPEDFGQHVGYLPQQVELFQGTIKQNIARMQIEINDDAVILAAKRAQVHNLILQLPNGYDTLYHPGAGLLSPGQLQRVGLARALYGNPKLVVLDEPNNNLDGEGERALLHVITMLKKARITSVIVAHRPTILQAVDHIMALRNGMVDGFDSRENMMLRYSPKPTGEAGAPQQIADQSGPSDPAEKGEEHG